MTSGHKRRRVVKRRFDRQTMRRLREAGRRQCELRDRGIDGVEVPGMAADLLAIDVMLDADATERNIAATEAAAG